MVIILAITLIQFKLRRKKYRTGEVSDEKT